MNIDLKSLRLLVKVIELGTVAAAAEHEHIAAAAISKRIRDLELSLGAKLIFRSNKGVVATPVGMMIVDSSRRILHDFDALPAQIIDFSKGLKGQVRVFANISSISQFLPRQLSDFTANNPLIRIHLEEKISSEIGRAVAENVADLGILVSGTPVDGAEYYPYEKDQLVLAVPVNHPLAGRDRIDYEQTLDYAYIGLHTGSQVNLQLIRAATDLGRSWICRMQVTSYDALCLMVEAGLGIGVLPRRIALSYAKALRIVPVVLEESWTHRTFVICCRRHEELSSPTRTLLNHLLDQSPLAAARAQAVDGVPPGPAEI